MRHVWVVAALCIVLIAGCGSSESQHPAAVASLSAPSPSASTSTAAESLRYRPTLTGRGRLLRHFEGLLRRRLGHHRVCGYVDRSAGRVDFRTGAGYHNCAPLATYFAYRYVFARSQPGGLRLAGKSVRGSYPNALFITVDGRYVSCSGNPSTRLMQVNNQPDFTLNCAAPL